MSSACFEPEGSSSGRRLCIQLWYGTFYMQQYKQSGRWKRIFDVEETPYICLPVTEPLRSKHVENLNQIKILIYEIYNSFVYTAQLYYNAR